MSKFTANYEHFCQARKILYILQKPWNFVTKNSLNLEV